ncbi:MAG: hypothetical protein R3B49_01345 [Phycisphaerales bacterium]
MRALNACLFGGTLFAAGIAHAQDFQFSLRNGGGDLISYGYAYGTDLPNIGSFDRAIDTNFNPASATFHIDASYNFFGGEAALTNHSMFANAFASSAYGPGYGRGIAYAYFAVASSVQLCIEWSFADEQPPFDFAYSTLVVTDATNAQDLFVVAEGDPDQGLACIDVHPGRFYAVLIDALAFEPFGDTFARVQLYAPPCPCDLDGSGVLNLDDIDAFAVAFIAGSLDADLDDNATLNLDDIAAFAQCFIGGCP